MNREMAESGQQFAPVAPQAETQQFAMTIATFLSICTIQNLLMILILFPTVLENAHCWEGDGLPYQSVVHWYTCWDSKL